MNRSLLLSYTLLAFGSGFLGAQAAETVALADYYYPPQQGARWHYQGTDWDGNPARARVILANIDWPLTLWTGRATPSPYQRPVMRFAMETGSWNGFGFDGFGSYDSWFDYTSLGPSWTYHGTDDDPGDNELHFDGGFSYPTSVGVGQSYIDAGDVFINGIFQFEAVMQLQVLDTTPLTVPAGLFSDCVHLRFTVTNGGTVIDQWDEWWARNVGMIKLQGLAGSGAPRLRELVSTSMAPADANLATALETPGRPWFNGGEVSWQNQTAVTHDGQDAAQAGVISGSQTSWMETIVEGPCTLEFWWKADFYGGDHFMVQIADSHWAWGEAPGGGSISIDWTKFSTEVPAGSHVMRWTSYNTAGSATGNGRVWVDKVSLPRPASPMIGSRERSAPQIAMVGESIDFTIDPSFYGRRYQLQQSEIMEPGNWINEGTEHVGNGGPLTIRIPRKSATPQCFYRIELDP